MISGTKYWIGAVVAGAALLGVTEPAAAQFRAGYHRMYNNYRPYRYGYGGYGGFGYNPYVLPDPYGGYLNGAANVINAQGQYLINTQQAYQMKEQVRAAQLENRRRTFDEYLYEKSLRPTLNDQRVLEQQQELRRALTNPPETEIWSAKSLNDLLMHIRDMRAKGADLPDVPINPTMLRQINVTVKEVGNVGLLKDAGRLNWPLGLQILKPEAQTTELRQQVDSLLVEGKKQASNTGRVDAGVLVNLTKDISTLRDQLVSRVSEYSFSDYTQAKSYLNQLDQAVKVLKQPDAGNYFNGKYQARGSTVGELTQYMTENGLKFAPAIAGEEAAYSALFSAMVQYYLGSGSQLQTQSATRDYYRGLYRQTRTAGGASDYQYPTQGLPAPPPRPPFPPR